MKVNDSTEADKSEAQLIHFGSRKLLRQWEALRAERPCPDRADIKLSTMAELLPNIGVIDQDATGKWVYRLAGTEICNLLQQQMTGRDVLAGFDTFERDVMSKTLYISMSRLQPSLFRMRLVATNNLNTPAEMLVLPVKDLGTGRVQLFTSLFAFPVENTPTGMLLRRELVSARVIWTEHEAGDRLLGQVGRQAPPRLRVINGGLNPEI